MSICGRDCNENQGRNRCADCPGRAGQDWPAGRDLEGLWRGIISGVFLGFLFWSFVIWLVKR